MKYKGAKKIVKRITPPLKVVNEVIFLTMFLAVAAIDCLLFVFFILCSIVFVNRVKYYKKQVIFVFVMPM